MKKIILTAGQWNTFQSDFLNKRGVDEDLFKLCLDYIPTQKESKDVNKIILRSAQALHTELSERYTLKSISISMIESFLNKAWLLYKVHEEVKVA